MRYPDHLIEQIREAADLLAVIGETVPLRRAGSSYKGLCPFHPEKTPSFVVHPDRNFYHCFGCGAGGNVFTFLMEHEKIAFPEAVERLANRLGIALPERVEDDPAAREREKLLEAVEFAATFFEKTLALPAGRKAREYLASRGVREEERLRFRLGASPEEWDGLKRAASGRFPEDLLRRAGLVVPRESGSGSYDRFRGRLMFPITNAAGKVVGFGARALDGSEPKYLNSPETEIYRKGYVLYGLSHAKGALVREGRAVLVEGYLDLIACHAAGIENAVALAGTALTEPQAALLRRHAKAVTVMEDGDPAGERATERALPILLRAGLAVDVVRLPEPHDPDSYLKEQGAPALVRLATGAGSFVAFSLRRLDAKAGATAKTSAVRGLTELLRAVPDPIYRQVLVQEAAARIPFDERVLAREAGGGARAETPAPSAAPGGTNRRSEAADGLGRRMLTLLLAEPSFVREAAGVLEPTDFEESEAREIFGTLRERGERGEPARVDALLDALPPSLAAYAAARAAEEWTGDPARSFQDLARALRDRRLRAEMEQVEREIRDAGQAGSPEILRALLARKQELGRLRKSLERDALHVDAS